MIKLENKDCVEGMALLNAESVDLTVTSPPYDNLRTYNGFNFDYKETFNQIYRVTKQGGVCVWIVADQTINGSESGTSFRQALYAMEIGFNLHDTMIWEKTTCAFPEQNRYSPLFEYMFVFSKGKPKTFNPIQDRKNKWGGSYVHGTFREADGTLRGRSATWKDVEIKEYGARYNVWNITEEKTNKTGHPAVFPLQLAEDHIKSWSNKGDMVLDPFSGSGTTAIAAYNLGRDFIGYEIDKEYYTQALKRIEDDTAQIRLVI